MSLGRKVATLLRALADVFDPPGPKEKRHHPGLKNPAELKDFNQPKPVAEAWNPGLPRQPGIWLPGEWGGPYL